VTTANPHAFIRPQISLLHYAPAMVLLLIVVADSAQFPTPISGDICASVRQRLRAGTSPIAIRILTAPQAPSGAITNG
jgi:hypothetical protein